MGRDEIENKLQILREAMLSQSNRVVKHALMEVIPTYRTPEEVNETATLSEEMKEAAEV